MADCGCDKAKQALEEYLHNELCSEEAADIREHLEGCVDCTDEERAHLTGLIDLGLTDSFRLFEQAEKSFSWWDYRDFGFRRNRGLRIDHILITDALKAQATACIIDKAPRKNERPSDHTPVVLTLN